MKTYNRYITLAAMALTFAACSQDEDFAPQTDGDAVKINATIGILPQTRLTYGTDGETTFASGDQIRVINHTRADAGKGKSDAVYQLGDWDSNEATEYTWEPATTTDYVVWNGTGSNTFYGVYPATAEYAKFTIPDDQRTDAQLTTADWMTATYSGAKSAGDVKFTFQHLLTKVTAKITTWNSEFDPNKVEIVETLICSMGENVTATYNKDATTGVITPTIDADEEIIFINSMKGGADPYPTYTAIVAPNAKYPENVEFVTIIFRTAEELIVPAKADVLANGLQPGKHYTFSLTVGKEVATISSVNVTEWDRKYVEGGVAEFVGDNN